jgi:hypothetical protein
MTLAKRNVAAAAVTFFFLFGSTRAEPTWKGIEKIAGRSPVTVTVEGKGRRYFQVTQKAPLSVELKGPARLRLISRVEIPEGTAGKISYGLRVTEGKRVHESQQFETLPSTEAHPARKGDLVGESRQLIVSVREGVHTLEISTEGERSVLVRLQTSSTRPGRSETVSLTPIDAFRSLSLKEDEKLVPYYSTMAEKPVRFRVVGPTKLELLSRLDFDQTMRGVQSYRLKVSVGSTSPREIEIRTTKALTATWSELADRIPSKFRRMEIPVGEGTQEISVELVKPTAGSAEIHARIPEPAVGKKE